MRQSVAATDTATDAGADALPSLRDLLSLCKPRITAEVLFTTAGGLWLAPGTRSRWLVALTLIGTGLVVAGANTLNMYLERDVDARMGRTRDRPLPAGRMAPRWALAFGVTLGVLGVPLLSVGVNPVTGLLGALALCSYVLVYTPLKRRSWVALIVGAVPGAIPPLLGWTAATGLPTLPGLALFGILFLWQVPHFIAISLHRQEDYARAGLHTLPGEHGVATAKVHAVLWVLALIPVSLSLVPLGVAGPVYAVGAALLGALFLGCALWGFSPRAGEKWARSLFHVSLVYLTGVFVLLLAGRVG